MALKSVMTAEQQYAYDQIMARYKARLAAAGMNWYFEPPLKTPSSTNPDQPPPSAVMVPKLKPFPPRIRLGTCSVPQGTSHVVLEAEIRKRMATKREWPHCHKHGCTHSPQYDLLDWDAYAAVIWSLYVSCSLCELEYKTI